MRAFRLRRNHPDGGDFRYIPTVYAVAKRLQLRATVTRLSVQHGFLRGIGWGLALASAIWALIAFSSLSGTYATGWDDLSSDLAFLRFDPHFLFGAVGLWLLAVAAVRVRRPGRGPLLPVVTPRVVRLSEPLEAVTCIECGTVSDSSWSGWRACRTEDPEGIEAAEISFFCPECAYREFGRQSRKF